jgi:predicted nucleotidyltransferase
MASLLVDLEDLLGLRVDVVTEPGLRLASANGCSPRRSRFEERP